MYNFEGEGDEGSIFESRPLRAGSTRLVGGWWNSSRGDRLGRGDLRSWYDQEQRR